MDLAQAPASALGSCCRKLQRWPWPCYSSLSFSQQEGAERNEGSTDCAQQSQPLPTGDGMWSKKPIHKKKSLHIYKCQNKYLRQTPPPLKHMRNHPANCSQDSLQGLREKSNDYTTGQPARLPSHFLMLLKPAAHWEGGGRASEAEHQHATVLERNVMV